MSTALHIAAIQHDIAWEDAEQTCARVAKLVTEAARGGARLVVLPEMFATGFSMRPDRIAEDEGGPVERFLVEQAGEHDVHLIASIAQRGGDGRFRNNAVLARPDATVQRYAKIHPFSYAGEHEQYAAGSTYLTTEIDDVRTSVFVCYDLRFADEFWALARQTDLYVVVANWPSARHEHWRTLLRARAIENQAYVLGVNRVGAAGTANPIDHGGGSLLIDPMGGVVVEGDDTERVLAGVVDPATVTATRAAYPFLDDRR